MHVRVVLHGHQGRARLNDDVYEDLVVVDRDGRPLLRPAEQRERDVLRRRVGVWNGGRPMSAVTADLDDDGDIDIALTEQGIVNRVRIFLNDGDANFTAGVFPTVGEDPEAIAAADLDGDDDLDLAVTLNAEATLDGPAQRRQRRVHGRRVVPDRVVSRRVDGHRLRP